jgi:hypothetical protein
VNPKSQVVPALIPYVTTKVVTTTTLVPGEIFFFDVCVCAYIQGNNQDEHKNMCKTHDT